MNTVAFILFAILNGTSQQALEPVNSLEECKFFGEMMVDTVYQVDDYVCVKMEVVYSSQQGKGL